MAKAKKVEVVEKVEKVEVVKPQHVVNHLDRRDGGTNWNESKALPSLDD